MQILYIILLILSVVLIGANALKKIDPWPFGLVLAVWLTVLTFAGR